MIVVVNDLDRSDLYLSDFTTIHLIFHFIFIACPIILMAHITDYDIIKD